MALFCAKHRVLINGGGGWCGFMFFEILMYTPSNDQHKDNYNSYYHISLVGMQEFEICNIGLLGSNFDRSLGMVVRNLVFSGLCVFKFFPEFSQFLSLLADYLILFLNHVEEVCWCRWWLLFRVLRVREQHLPYSTQ